MLNVPKSKKFRKDRKFRKGKVTGISRSGYNMHMGDYGLQALENGKLYPKQIEALRSVVSKKLGGRRKSIMRVRVFPHIIVTRKPAEVRMGGGKGSPETHVCFVRKGDVILEISGFNTSEIVAKDALDIGRYKLPIRTKFLKNEELGWMRN